MCHNGHANYFLSMCAETSLTNIATGTLHQLVPPPPISPSLSPLPPLPPNPPTKSTPPNKGNP